MRKAIIRLRQDVKNSFMEMRENFVQAWRHNEYRGEIFEFESPIDLFNVLTPVRWQLIEYLQSKGALTFSELLTPFSNEDISALLDIGLIEKNEQGQLYIPFEEIHADFMLRSAA